MFVSFLATVSHWFRTVSSNTPAVRSKLRQCDFPITSYFNKTASEKKIKFYFDLDSWFSKSFFLAKSFSFL